MTDMTFAYSTDENGWVSEEVTLTGHCVLLVSLKDNGVVVVKKRNESGGDNPKVYISKRLSEMQLKITGAATDKIIQVLTGTEPNYIRYAYI